MKEYKIGDVVYYYSRGGYCKDKIACRKETSLGFTYGFDLDDWWYNVYSYEELIELEEQNHLKRIEDSKRILHSKLTSIKDL